MLFIHLNFRRDYMIPKIFEKNYKKEEVNFKDLSLKSKCPIFLWDLVKFCKCM